MKDITVALLTQAIHRLAESNVKLASSIEHLAEKTPLLATSPIEAAEKRPTPNYPEFIRLPKQNERCAYTGLSRSFIYTLAEEGKIHTIQLRKRGNLRGVRLIDLGSLLDYIRRQSSNSSDYLK